MLSGGRYRHAHPAYLPATASKLGTANTDWQDEIYQLAYGGDYNVSVSGAAGKLPYRVSTGFYHQEGVLKTDKMNRFSGDISLNPPSLRQSPLYRRECEAQRYAQSLR